MRHDPLTLKLTCRLLQCIEASSIDSQFRDFKDKIVCQYLAERSTDIHICLYIIQRPSIYQPVTLCSPEANNDSGKVQIKILFVKEGEPW